jgi:predicted XRE-type DNA-binding protein
MKIQSVQRNNRKRAFEVKTWRGIFSFPYSKANPAPTPINTVTEIYIDEDLGGEGFRYKLASGSEGSVHIEQVLEYNKDPAYMRDLLLYKLTIEAQKQIEQSNLSKREIIRRLNTSPAQFYRLIDSTNYRKSIDKMLLLLNILDCDVDLSVKERSA